VSGKGLGAALLTTMLQGACRALHGRRSGKGLQPHQSFLCRHAEVGRYATMFIGMVGKRRNARIHQGGHPSPLLLRRAK
jgi:phosphoserine phosphatase RsbU/P